jgi:hypothetical protein
MNKRQEIKNSNKILRNVDKHDKQKEVIKLYTIDLLSCMKIGNIVGMRGSNVVNAKIIN